jgi:hypothetical protein
MTLPERLLAVLSVPVGFVIAWTLYLNVVGSIGPVELLEVVLLTTPIAIETYRILHAGMRALARRRATARVPAGARHPA